MNAYKCAAMMKAFSNDPIGVANRLRLKNTLYKIKKQTLVDECIEKYEDKLNKAIESPLTDDEISCIYRSTSHNRLSLRKVANASHKEALKKVCEMNPKTSLNRWELKNIIDNNKNDIDAIQQKIIEQFLFDIRRSIGE